MIDLDYCVTRTNIIKERDWSPQMIIEFLGAPDGVFPNSRGKNLPQIKLYKLWRVIECEKTIKWRCRYQLKAHRGKKVLNAKEKRKQTKVLLLKHYQEHIKNQ